MKVQLAIIFALFFSVIVAHKHACRTKDLSNSAAYDLSSLMLPSGTSAYSYLDKDNERQWYWNVCGSVNGLLDNNGENISVTEDSAVVIFKNYTSINDYIVDGTNTGVILTALPDGTGVNIFYPGIQDLSDPTYTSSRGTSMTFLCDSTVSTLTVTSIVIQESSDTIVMSTSAACPTYYGKHDMGMMSMSSSFSRQLPIPVFMIVGIVLAVGALCSCVVCCCVRRRARCRAQCKRARTNKYELQNVSFQPVPQSDTADKSFAPNPMQTNWQPQPVQFMQPQMMTPQQNQMSQQYPFVYMQQPQQYFMPGQGQQPFLYIPQQQPKP